MRTIIATLLAAAVFSPAAAAPSATKSAITVDKRLYGKMPDGTVVDQYTLQGAHGITVQVITYGAIITTVETPDRQGHRANITLNCPTLKDYLAGHPCFGCIIGRYANRIAGARFTIDGKEFRLPANNGRNHIHGGTKGFDKYVWKAAPVRGKTGAGVRLTLVRPDGDEGYPGKLSATVIYTLTGDGALRMEYLVTTTRPTHVNLTNHAYWNLAGAGAGDVLGHKLQIHAERYLPVDKELIPTGPPRSVHGTPFDFTQPHTIGERIDRTSGGYDHCYVLTAKPDGRLRLAARVVEPRSGRVLEVSTTQPGVQLYTANGLSWKDRAGRLRYGNHGGFCLETQHFPDSPNRPDFPSTLLKPEQTYREVTVYRFGVH